MTSDSALIKRLNHLASSRGLPERYVDDFLTIVAPIIDQKLYNKEAQQPQIIGVQGCQGSGKTTICKFIKCYLEHQYSKRVEVCSIDDFYLTKDERRALAARTHPLLATRGVPGTHDTSLIRDTFEKFRHSDCKHVPTFNKKSDDRYPQDQWAMWQENPQVLIFEGWCVGMSPQSNEALVTPINKLEQSDDSGGQWRQYVNNALNNEYQDIFASMDSLLVLQAPSFDCVYEWRLKQEQQMIQGMSQSELDNSAAMNPEQIKRFISHYQRLTEHGFKTLAKVADATLRLNTDHSFAEPKGNYNEILS